MNFRLIAYSANVLQAIRHIRFLNELKTALGSAAFIIYLIYIYYRGVWHEVHSVASGVLVQPHFGHFFPLTVPLDKSPSAILPCVALIENPTHVAVNAQTTAITPPIRRSAPKTRSRISPTRLLELTTKLWISLVHIMIFWISQAQ